jgi:hypothetical protein
LLGLLIGIQHALEADHVAAVASIATRAGSVRRIVRHGVIWGFGHSATPLVVGGAVLLCSAAVPEGLARALELAVGVMLLGLGVLRRLLGERVHVHLHRHGDGVVHIHAHSHAGDRADHESSRHDHDHPPGLPLRSLLVGVMHGMAGSAALLVLALASVQSTLVGLLHIAVFGVGSIVGMAALSAVIAVPLTYSARLLNRLRQVPQAAIGGATLLVGAMIVYRTAVAAW